MKKILLLRAYNTYNNGSFMMPINLMFYLNSISKEKIKFYVNINSKEQFLRYKQELPKEIQIEMFPLRKITPNMGYWEKVFKKLGEPLFQPKKISSLNPDAIIYFGGDELSECYSKIAVLVELLKFKRISKKTPIFLASQTIGPFTGIRKPIASNILKKCNIYLRDPLCAEHLRNELKIKDFMISSDLAFLDLPHQNKNSLLKKYKLSKNKYITLVPSGMYTAYTDDKNHYISSWIKMIKSFYLHKKLKDKKIVLLPHMTTRPIDKSDIDMIKKIVKRLPTQFKSKVIPIYRDLLPSEAREILGNGLFTITGRMHAAISTFQMGKPAISLSYSIKYKGIIGIGLKLPELIIESRNNALWNSGKIVSDIGEKVTYVLDNYSSLSKKIKIGCAYLKSKVMDQIKDISNKIENETCN